MIKVGETIRKLRSLKGYSQESMARELNLSPNGYAKIERDETDITLKRLELIAEKLDTTVFKILDFDEKRLFCMDNNHNNSTGHFQQTQQIHFDESLNKLVTHLQEEVNYLRQQNGALTQQNIQLTELINKKG